MFDGAILVHPRALVHAARGLIPAAELATDDRLFSLDEKSREIRPAEIVSAGAGPRTDLVELRVGTRVIQASADTRVRVLVDRRRPGRIRRRFKAEWIALRDVKVGDIVGIARKTPDLGVVQAMPVPVETRDRRARPVSLPTLADENLMWWAGLYIGDGFVHHSGRRRRIEFAIPSSEPELRRELADVTSDLFAIDSYAKDDWRVVVPAVRLVDFVYAIGLRGKALEKRVPRWVFRSPEAHRLAFLGGYVDADGLVRAAPKSKDMGVTSANPLLIEDVRQLAITCGIRTTRVWSFTGRHPTDPARVMTGYRMQFSGDFDRVGCRALERRERMHKRRFFHTDLHAARSSLKAHGSDWLGFGTVKRAATVGVDETCAIVAGGGGALVVERLIVATSSSTDE